MRKKELIQNLRDAREFVVEYDKIMAKINKSNTLPGCLAVIVATFLYLSFVRPSSFWGFLLTILGWFVVSGAVFGALDEALKQSRESKYKGRIAELDQKFQSYIDISIKYFNTEKINGLISILESGLADTLKEALFIWEERENNKTQMELLKQQNKLMEEQIYATHQAAKAAKRAAKEVESFRDEYHHY
jgi:hypothetical protein